ncbi:MAG: N-acetylmuramidase family protein [Chloroflexi bacterium]|nr:MAG: N-acetylmuramidase family protein [Chloroflexota bacterium]
MVQQQYSSERARPKSLHLFFHFIKTTKLVGALLRDGRIRFMPKVFFVGSIAAMLVILIFPDVLNEVVLSTVLPIVGTVLGVPLDAGLDWVAFALLIVNLLRFFPAEVVTEHYERIFTTS